MPGTGHKLDRYMRSIGRDPTGEYILMTHSQPDHRAAAFGITRRTGPTIVAHHVDTKATLEGDVSLSYMDIVTRRFQDRIHVPQERQ